MSVPDARARRLARLAARTDWSKVVDPYTGEAYGPEMLAGLWAPDRVTADETCAALRHTAIGDGSAVRAAAAQLLPFLVEAARDPDVTVRFAILRTIAALADTGNTAPAAKVDTAWAPAWDRTAPELLPLLGDGDPGVRGGAAHALARSTAHAGTLIPRFRARFGDEPDPWAAGCLVRGVGELARQDVEGRDEAVAWLRDLMAVAGKGPEPDLDQDADAWVAWDEEIRHDVRLQAVEALCRALPGYADPRYAPVTTAALLAPSALPPAEGLVPTVDVIAEADRRLGADLPGRLALAHALLRHGGTAERAGGLRVAGHLMPRWPSAVPELLPAVARLVDDTSQENREAARRLLAKHGTGPRR
ncbi:MULTISPECIES: HEAT repeat domain-containing protein [unclassified Streptomyces]|uniref:HEAT repeat domain-containing protein n=1 Tax=unclassified Streptomyces TaxID=2593676 RepID=UPI00037AE371|nr:MULTISPECIES: HEAT repeat domain-containing protein [unclassified Streptomyces]MYQ78117.1 hypothetical protein [Streptomyces sp. SID4923]